MTDVGVPKLGVTSVGLVANTNEPEPVSSVTAEAKLALVGVPKNVATPVPRPLTPELIGKPVQLVQRNHVVSECQNDGCALWKMAGSLI